MWSAEIEMNRETLKRIVALLFSMACLAEGARTASRKTRFKVLSYLRYGQIVAWHMVLRDVYGVYAAHDLIEEVLALDDDSPADATHLAIVLRAIAMVLTIRFALYRNLSCGENRDRTHENLRLLRRLHHLAPTLAPPTCSLPPAIPP